MTRLREHRPHGESATGVPPGEVLARRARELARPLELPAGEERMRVICFSLDGEAYGIEAGYTFEALRMRPFAPLAAAGEPLVGLLSWRGDLLPLLDLVAMTRRASGGTAARAHSIILGDERPAFAIGVDSVDGIVSLPGPEIHPAQALSGAFIRGLTSSGAVILDAGELIRSYSERELQ